MLTNKRTFLFLTGIFIITSFSSCLKERKFPVPTSAPTGTLVINEFMAYEHNDYGDNLGTGAGSDWMELYNGTDTTITFGANQWYVSDTIGAPNKFLLPATIFGNPIVLPSHQYLVIYCDGFNTTNSQIHTSFKLGHSSGDVVLYYAPTGGTARIVDKYTYGTQSYDISMGRIPNGGSSWSQCATPTPGAANQ